MRLLVCLLLVSASIGVLGCNNAKSPDEVQNDVSKATSEAAQNDTQADQKRKDTEAAATADLAKERAQAQTRAVDKSVAAVVDSAVTEAEGANKVALAKCGALEGGSQQQCKVQANEQLQAVRDRARAAKGSLTQTQ